MPDEKREPNDSPKFNVSIPDQRKPRLVEIRRREAQAEGARTRRPPPRQWVKGRAYHWEQVEMTNPDLYDHGCAILALAENDAYRR